MGTDISTKEKKRKFLSDSDLIKENNNYLRELFLKYKNFDGLINQNGLYRMTNGLIDKSILEIIFKICSTKENKLLYNDLLYFYALLKTKSFDAKMNFLLYFIFSDNSIITKEIYKNKVKKYYQNSYQLYKIFLNENIILNNNKIEKTKVFNYIKNNFKEDIENYQLNKDITNLNYDLENEPPIEQKDKQEENHEENQEEKQVERIDSDKTNMILENEKEVFNRRSINIVDKLNINNNNIRIVQKNISRKNSFNKHLLINQQKFCLCLSKKNSVCGSVDFSRLNTSLYNKYDSLKERFDNYKEMNNGIFPLSLLEDMLKEINIVPSLIDLISNYIKKRAQKGICTFELFKEVLSILTIPLDDEENKEKNKKIFSDGLFLLFSYPNDYIDKTDFCSFIQLTRKDYTLNSINSLLNKYEFSKKISKDKFKEIVEYLINEIIESLEHIKYIPYIFFGIDFTDKKIEKHIIDILLNGEDINKYLMKRIKIDDIFYVIDFKFWKDWNKLMNGENFEEKNNLKINTESICDQNGKINEGLVYLTDYIILSRRMYELFCKWYNTPSIELEREKIYIEDGDENSLYYQSLKNIDKEISPFLKGEDVDSHKKFEIEINPVFLVFLNFQEVQNSCENSFSKFKEQIKSKVEDKNTSYYKFSRKEKFSNLLATLQESVEMELDENNSRLWIYYQDRFEIVPINDTLEKQGIFNKAAILLEINKTGFWPIEDFGLIKKEIEDKNDENFSLVGLMNIGNSCYMNSVLQIFLNISEIKDIFFDTKKEKGQDYLDFLINYKSEKDILVEEFINLLLEKWAMRKKTLSPRRFKDTCGRLNENFKGFIQQDAYDFYTFLVQNLHEGTNIKTKEINIINKEIIDTNENELGNEYWANAVRNNASYIYSLFMGQLQSKLICNKCQKSKIKYEIFSALDLPLPEENKIKLYIKLFRLPLSLSPFNKDNSNKESITSYLKNIKKNKIGNYNIKNDFKLNEENNINIIIEKKRFDISLNEQTNLELQTSRKLNILSKTSSKDELITNELNLNIPILLKIEISRKEKCQEIISILKKMNELNLDTENKYTEFIIVSNDKYINPDLLINETLESSNQIEVYELLNFEGLKKVFNYEDISENALSLNTNDLNSTINREPDDDKEQKNTDNSKDEIIKQEIKLKETLLEIKHRFRKNWEGEEYLVNIPVYSEILSNRDFIILTNKRTIKIIDLYDMMWEKYMYFCDMPTKLENNLWWRNIIKEKKEDEIYDVEEEEDNKKNDKNQNTKIKYCSPFVIKILNKKTMSCAYCPWFRVCTGCILDPNYREYISIPKNCYIIIEWCRRVKVKQIKDENPLLCLNHSSVKENVTEENNITKKISIYDCLDLFTKKEIIEDVFCENCKEKQTFTKMLKIERIPEYLVISLKRFKYTTMFKSKIKCPIKFPLNGINLKNYLIENSQQNSKVYDLFAVVDHLGNLSGGHYHSIIKHNNKWIKYNDSTVSEVMRTFDTQNAYILVYKFVRDNNANKYFKFNFRGLMDTAYKIYIKQNEFKYIFNYLTDEKGEIIEEYKDNCEYYYGEPVTVDKTRGYLINISQKDGNIYAKIKINKNYLTIKYSADKIVKDTIKDNDFKKTDIKNNNNPVVCEGCYIL